MNQMTQNSKREYHTPVMLDEVVWLMNSKPGGVYIDCTLGSGGHALGLLEFAGAGARIIGIDRDQDAISTAKQELRHFSEDVYKRQTGVWYSLLLFCVIWFISLFL